MMKLRLAQPSRLIDINDLTELQYIREEGDEIAIGALTRHVRPARVRAAARALPGLPRRRAGDRRPGRAQPRHDRRLALPGRRGRGPLRGRVGAEGAASSIRGADGRARGRDGRVPPRPVDDRGRRGRDRSPRSASRCGRAPGSAHEKVERRAGDWAIAAASAAVWLDGDTIADAGIALCAVGLTTVDLTRAEELLRGQTPSDDAVRAGGRDRVRGLHRRSPTAAAPSTTSATSRACSPNARSARRRHARCSRRPDEHLDHHQRRDRDARRRAAHAARPLHPRHARA